MISQRRLITLSDKDLINLSSGEVKVSTQFTFKQENTYKAIPGGLYDITIFGQKWRCSCGFQRRPGKCPRCGVQVISESESLSRFGYYKLNVPVIYWSVLMQFIENLDKVFPGIYEILKKAVGNVRSDTDRLVGLWSLKFDLTKSYKTGESDYQVKDSSGQLYNVDISIYNSDDRLKSSEYEHYGLIAIYNIINSFNPLEGSFDLLKTLIHKVIMIAPVDYREVSIFEDQLQIPTLSYNYCILMQYCEIFEKLLDNDNLNLADILTLSYGVNKIANEIIRGYSIVASSKQSMMRGAMTGRVPESGRATIVGVPNLEVDKVMVPKALAYEALNAPIIAELKYRFPDSDPFYLYRNPNKDVMEIFETIASNSVAIVGRQPSLHEFSAFALIPELWDKSVLGLPMGILEPYNADFDGDQMYCIFIHKDPQKTLAYNTMSPRYNWYYNKTKKPIYIPKNSFLLGLHFATKLVSYKNPPTEFFDQEQVFKAYDDNLIEFDEIVLLNGVATSYGRERVSKIIGIPLDSFIGTDPITSNNIGNIIALIGSRVDKSGKPINVEILRDLNVFGADIITEVGIGGSSLKEMFLVNTEFPEIKTILDSNMSDQEKWSKLEHLMPKLVKSEIEKLPSGTFSSIMKAGGKLKLPSLVEMFGPRIEFKKGKCSVVYQSLMTGLDEETVVAHTTSNRVILEQKAAQIPISGYIQRQVYDLNIDVVYKTDKKSNDVIGIWIPRNLAEGRTTMDGKVLPPSDSKKLVKVKSSATSGVDYVTEEEVDRNFYKLRNNQLIGVSQSTSMMEQIIQNQLKLKHGGQVWTPSEDWLTLKSGGTNFTNLGNRFKILIDNEYKIYPLPKNKILSFDAVNGVIPKDGIVYYLDRPQFVDYALIQWHTFIGAAHESKAVSRIKTKQCYSYSDGTIHYDYKKRTVTIGDFTYDFYDDEVYYFAEGDKVSLGDKICSGVLDLNHLANNLNDLSYVFYIFMTEAYNIIGKGVSLESLEILFKGLSKSSDFKMRTSLMNSNKLFNRLAYGYAAKSLKASVNKDIEDSILVRIYLDNGNLDTYPLENKSK